MQQSANNRGLTRSGTTREQHDAVFQRREDGSALQARVLHAAVLFLLANEGIDIRRIHAGTDLVQQNQLFGNVFFVIVGKAVVEIGVAVKMHHSQLLILKQKGDRLLDLAHVGF